MTIEIFHELYDLCAIKPTEHDWLRMFRKLTCRSWTDCWEWKAAISQAGYGLMTMNCKSRFAHRLMYRWVYGEIPADLEVDHRWCSNPICVNPLHLIATTHWVNTCRPGSKSVWARNVKVTHCPQGHEYSGSNLIIRGGTNEGHRVCRACKIIGDSKRGATYRARKREQKQLKISSSNY